MSEIVSMSSGPQGAAKEGDAFEQESSSSEFGQQESETGTSTSSAAEDNVPHGTNGEQNGEDGQPKSGAGRKALSKYERTKKQRAEFHKQQEVFRQERESLNQQLVQFNQQQAQFNQERARFEEAKKPKRDYTLGDLKKYRALWKREADQGDYAKAELVERADAEIAVMEEEAQASKTTFELPKRGTSEHQQQWQAAERELSQTDPDFMKSGTKLDTKLRAIFSGPNADAYRDHPQGIYAAYDRARREILEEDNKGLRTELSQLKKELQRYGGLTSIGGGVPGRMGDGGVASTADFARLSSTDMRKHLLARSKQSRDSTGWL